MTFVTSLTSLNLCNPNRRHTQLYIFGFQQAGPTSFQGSARGEDVIDEEYVPVAYQLGPGQAESVQNISHAFHSGFAGLGGSVRDSLQHPFAPGQSHAFCKTGGETGGLIIAAAAVFSGMQRNGNDEVNTGEVRALPESAAVVPAQFQAYLAFTCVFQLMDQLLRPSPLYKMVESSAAVERNTSPKSLGEIILGFQVKMGVG